MVTTMTGSSLADPVNYVWHHGNQNWLVVDDEDITLLVQLGFIRRLGPIGRVMYWDPTSAPAADFLKAFYFVQS